MDNLWGNRDINKRDEYLVDFVIPRNLERLTQGNGAIFATKILENRSLTQL